VTGSRDPCQGSHSVTLCPHARGKGLQSVTFCPYAWTDQMGNVMRLPQGAWTTVLSSAAPEVSAIAEARRGAAAPGAQAVADRLAASALRLFSLRGFDDVTVGEIAEAAGVASRTFFPYFPTKETVVLDLWDSTKARLCAMVVGAEAAASVLEVLDEALASWYASYSDPLLALDSLAQGSTTLELALLRRTAQWEASIAATLRERFPDLDGEDAIMWASVGFALLRVAGGRASRDGTSFAESSRATLARFQASVRQAS
jgi:AcrR family transcriptional regulator